MSFQILRRAKALQRLAVLDLGSTSFHLLVAEADAEGQVERLLRKRIMLRLGAVIANDGSVPETVCERAVAAARELRDEAARAGAQRLLPVATAALRDAANGAELAARIERAVAAPVRMLSGEEEARLIFGAFRQRLDLGSERTLGVDLGGGSLELAVGDGAGVSWETTLPLGVARLHGELVARQRGGAAARGPLSKKSVRAIRERVCRGLDAHAERLGRLGATPCVATGGTTGALARLAVARRSGDPGTTPNGFFLPARKLRKLSERLARATHRECLAMPGIQRRRADLLPAGAVVLSTVAQHLGLDGFTVCDWGLREGVVLESLGLVQA